MRQDLNDGIVTGNSLSSQELCGLAIQMGAGRRDCVLLGRVLLHRRFEIPEGGASGDV